jgi:hypothetical protein
VKVLIISHFEGKFMIAEVETTTKIKGQLDSDLLMTIIVLAK